MAEKIVQTAGRDALGDFAPEFAHYNDDILFGENWNNQDIDVKTRCMLTVTAIMAQGLVGDALKHHIMKWQHLLLTWLSMQVGLRLGQYLTWQRKCMGKAVKLNEVRNKRNF